MTSEPQDDVTSATPQDAPAGAVRRDAAVAAPAASGTGLEPGWYASPDGAPTLSWWTGAGWSRVQQPIARPATEQPVPTSYGRVVSGDPPAHCRAPGPSPRRGGLPKRYVPAVLLSILLGPVGLFYASWRVALAWLLGWALLSGSLDHDAMDVATVVSRPLVVVLAVLTVAWHNHRLRGDTGAPPRA